MTCSLPKLQVFRSATLSQVPTPSSYGSMIALHGFRAAVIAAGVILCLSLTLSAMGGSNSSLDRAGTRKCSTHLGEVEVQILGPEESEKPLILALHGMSSADFILREWDAIASQLAGQGYRVALPNLHSNPKTAPKMLGGVTETDAAQLLQMLVSELSPLRPIVLMGKSWGGATAAKFAHRHPDLVEKLVLVCPASTPPLDLRLPLLLLWAEDDWVTWFRQGVRAYEECPQLTLQSSKKGGHRILPEYWQPLQSFLAPQ
ncbi:unnamed protein product [Effrenium voratum]|nr:unnamed protein product [Effrenium voratum]